MASSSNIKTLKKPLLIIKKGSLFYKPSTPIFLRTPLKRPICLPAGQIDDPNAKRMCSESDLQTSPEKLIQKVTVAEKTTANTNNATDVLSGEATDPLSEKTDQLSKTTDQLSEATDQLPKATEQMLEPTDELQLLVPLRTSKSQPVPKIPKNKCEKHPDLIEHQAEGLPQVGDSFNSVEEFNDYNAQHASQWLFYYFRYDTRNPKNGSKYNSQKPTYCCFECRFNQKEGKSQSKGIRIRKKKTPLQCPASVILKCDPGQDVYQVRDACHHHSHELSRELFNQLPHGIKALPQEVKDEIRDLAQFNVQPLLLRRYIESKIPGLARKKMVYNHLNKMKNKDIRKNMSPERTKEMLEKIRYIKANFNDSINVRVLATKKKPTGSSISLGNELRSNSPEDTSMEDDSSMTSHDQEVQQSVTELQNSGCETQVNPWVEPVLNEMESDNAVEYEKPVTDEVETSAIGEEEYVRDVPDETPTEVSANDSINNEPNPNNTNPLIIIGTPNTLIIDNKQPYRLMLINKPVTSSLNNRDSIFTFAGTKALPCAQTTDNNIHPLISENVEQINAESTNKSIKRYQIGDITIETEETIDESGKPSIVLHQIKSNTDLTAEHLIGELSKLERSVTESKPMIGDLSELESSLAESAKQEKKKKRGVERIDPKVLSPEKMMAAAVFRCQNRHGNVPEYHAEGFIKIGDTFPSMAEFARYSASHALKWFFYYYVHDSRNVRSSKYYKKHRTTWYNFACRFNKGGYKSTSTGVRKVRQKTIQCPAAVSMRSKPGEELFTVVYVCHHHSHELTPEIFSQEAHGHRLPPEMKDEIRELAWYELDSRLINQYLQNKTGFDLKLTVKNVIYKMRKENVQINVSPEREKQILETIREIKSRFTIPKRGSSRNKDSLNTEPTESEDEQDNKSRVEVRLNNILYDQELIQSVKELQQTTGCDLQLNEWGEVNVVDNSISNLQAGLKEETGYDVQDANDENDSQIEIEEAYSIDENVRYIIPPNHEGYVFGEDDITEEVENADEIVKYDDVPLDDNNIDEDITESPECMKHEATFDFSDNENEYQTMYQYTNDEDSGDESSEHVNAQRFVKETYESRDIGVQAETHAIDLAEEYEKINRLEEITIEHDVKRSIHKYATRGRPQAVLEEAIINRFNIEFYISYGGVIPCLENLAVGMGTSVLELLKKLYQGDAVFKMIMGRAGKNDRKTVQLTYVPLTITFPFEKFKYTNALKEYKKMCSKYSDVASKLEDVTEKLSSDLKAMTTNFENAELHNQQLLKMMENLQDVLNVQNITAQLLKKSQDELAAAQAANNALETNSSKEIETAYAQIEVLLKKIKEQDDLQIASRLKDAEILKTLLEPSLERNKSNKTRIENKFLRERIKELEEKSPVNIRLTEKIKTLEQELQESVADSKRYQEKARKLEELYLNDSQSLLDKIKVLEEELSTSNAELNYHKSTENPASYIIRYTESENKRLYREIKSLEADNKKYIVKVKTLNDTIDALNTQLNELQ